MVMTIPMIAITIMISIRVKPRLDLRMPQTLTYCICRHMMRRLPPPDFSTSVVMPPLESFTILRVAPLTMAFRSECPP
jgi:hypothetical protein